MLAWVEWTLGRWTELITRVALAAERCVGLVPLWKLGTVESACNVGHRYGRNGLAGLGGCIEKRRQIWSPICAVDSGSEFRMKKFGL